MNYKKFKQYVDKTNKNIADKLKDNEEELTFYTMLVKRFNDICEENEKLKKQLEHCYCNRTDCSSRIKDSKKYDSLQQENEKLKKQLEYLRSGEYYNQLRFENEMLQDAVDNGKVSKEDREFIDCTHRNTELLEQQQEFIKYLKSINSFVTIGNILNKYKEIIGVSDD